MELERTIELLEECCNVYYDVESFNSIEDLLYEYYIDSDMFTEEEIKLVTDINGWNEEAFNDMLFARYGYRDLEQMLDE